MGFVQEFQAGSIVDELKKTLALKATVLREGRMKEVDAPELVPGDILQVEEVRSSAAALSMHEPYVKFRVQLFLRTGAS